MRTIGSSTVGDCAPVAGLVVLATSCGALGAAGFALIGQTTDVAHAFTVPVLGLAAGLVGMIISAWSLVRRTRRDAAIIRGLQTRPPETSHAASLFVASAAHELRAPLTAILGYSELLRGDADDPVRREDTLRTIERNGRHMLGIVNDLLDHARIESGRMPVERIPVNTRALVDEAAAVLRPAALERGLALRTQIESDVPLIIRTDPLRLRQILINLLANAVKFTDSGGVTLRVSREPSGPILPERGDPAMVRVRFDVADTGIGLTAEQLARLFEPFSQADTSVPRRHGGSGLGLAVSQRLAGLLGGRITCTSPGADRASPGGAGSTFTLDINVEALDGLQDAHRSGPVPSDAAEPRTQPSLLGLRILLAEDGPDNQRLFTTFLERAGARVTTVESGRLAVEHLLSGQPADVVFMDVQMPELDGLAATAMLRQRGYAGPIIGITAHGSADRRQECLAAGCNAYLSKPVERRQLVETARRWADDARRLQRAAG